MAPRSRARRLVVLVAGAASLSLVSCTPWIWVGFGGAAADTPAEVTLDLAESNPQQTTLELRVHGFWWRWRARDGERYREIRAPGLARGDQVGAPDLPYLPLRVAVPTDAAEVLVSVEVLESQLLTGYQPWPVHGPASDHVPGSLPVFARDEGIYGSALPFPSGATSIGAIQPRFRSVPAAEGRAFAFQWSPGSDELQVTNHVRYTLDHGGAVQPFDPMPMERSLQASHAFPNWPAVESTLPTNFSTYHGAYLLLYPSAAYADDVAPLAVQKRARGFVVTEMTVDSIVAAGATCADIRGAIQGWLAGVPEDHDAYALLVGDTDVIPLCDAPGGLLDNVGNPIVTDDLYASPGGDDLVEEVYLGRLSVDDEADAAAQVAKILAYEDTPSPFCCYDRALLWSGRTDPFGGHDYGGIHEAIMAASLAVMPIFTHLEGLAPPLFDPDGPLPGGPVNDDAVAELDVGPGLVSYRGHGQPFATAASWDELDEDFHGGWVQSLANPVERSPVVWGIACSNAAIFDEDAIAEVWMEHPTGGAVSYYGATSPSWTHENDILTRALFRAVYDLGIVDQAQAIEQAESELAFFGGGPGRENAWRYLLLGDPDLQIRRENPIDLDVLVPLSLELCGLPPCFLDVEVQDEAGAPVEGALVGLWKEGGAGGDEVFANGYTDASGVVSLAADAVSTGILYYTVQDGLGNSVFDSLQIVSP